MCFIVVKDAQVHRNSMLGRLIRRRGGIRGVVVCLCLCVVLQILGSPATLFSAGMSDVLSTAHSEGFSIPPTMFVPEVMSLSYFLEDALPSFHLPVIAVSYFHPPLQA